MFQRALTAWAVATCLALSAPMTAVASEPLLELNKSEPVDLIFDREADVKDIYKAIGKAFGVQPVFESRFRSINTTLRLQEVDFFEALEVLNQMHSHFWVPLDEKNFLILDDTPQNRRTYETVQVKTFVVENADLPDVMTILRSIIGLKNVAIDSETNRMTIRDTAPAVALAGQLIKAHDVPAGEVEITLEIVETTTRQIADLGSRPATEALNSKLAKSNRLVRGRVSVLGSRSSTLAVSGQDGALGSIKADLKSRVHSASGQVTVSLNLALSGDGINDAEERNILTSSWRLKKEQSALIELPSQTNDGKRLALVLTPHVISASTEVELPALNVGTVTLRKTPQVADE